MAHESSDATPVGETDRGVRGSAWLLVGRLFAVGVGLTTQVILVRTLGKSEFGVWALGLALALGLQIVVSLGHNRVVSRFFSVHRERRDAAGLVGTLLTEAVLIAVLGALALVAAVVGWFVVTSPLAAAYEPVLILIVLAPLQALEELLENLFAAFGKVLTIVVRQHVLIPLLRLILVGGLAVAGVDLTLLATGYVAVSVISLSFYGAMLHRLVKTDRVFATWRFRDVRFPQTQVFRFSVPMLSGELVYLINGTVNVVLLGLVKSSTSVGALRAIMPFADANLLVRRQFFRLFLPLAAALHEREDRDTLRDAYWRNASWVAVLSLPLFLLTGPFAAPLTSTVLGSEYATSAPYLAIFASAYYLNAAVGFNAELLHAVARLRYITGVNLAAAAVALGGTLALTPALGALGVAVATAGSVLLQNLLNQWGLRRHLGAAMPPPPYRRVYVALLAASVLMTLLAATLRPGLAAACGLAGVVSILVMTICLPALKPAQAFPELLRLPGVRSKPGAASSE